MKLISIVGSPHGLSGNTAKLLQIVLKGAQSQGAEYETIILRGDSVLPCLGCDRCHKKGSCAQPDEFESIRRRVEDADGLILASPNYIFSVSAQMKAFMDRCCGVIHRLGFEGKYGVSVVTSGGGDEAPIAAFMNHFLMMTGIVPVGAVWATMGAVSGDNFPEEIHTKAFELGRRIVSAWNSRETFPEFEQEMSAFRERMKRLISYRRDEWPYEYDYWIRHRGLRAD